VVEEAGGEELGADELDPLGRESPLEEAQLEGISAEGDVFSPRYQIARR
jgi:hypothetical protein